ncbi:hypothetical protein [Chengkuizengella sediminis]|uniref:hypothetical protein n=1 Tax=Chengkuizengella sediminis TaxID=1885917 RepID=UPI00138A0A67|nr:hypothetical protein [Chengkuizengella sediminis]NDI35266.1 hypothetical protein [Chengkuizengella sediminis]
MKQWRVGTLSMACSLILLGIVLFLSQIWGYEILDILITWWPLIIVLIGLEILVYLFISKKENPVIKYDIFSILFVGFIGVLCILLFMFTSTGLIEEVRYALNEVESNQELPTVNQTIPEEIKRIIVQTNNQFYHSIQVDSTKERELHLFGNAFIRSSYEGSELKLEDYFSQNIVGDTMYVTLKNLPRKSGLASDYKYMNVTLVLPEQLKVEMDDRYTDFVMLTESDNENWNLVTN